jgi:hypothetical protein
LHRLTPMIVCDKFMTNLKHKLLNFVRRIGRRRRKQHSETEEPLRCRP